MDIAIGITDTLFIIKVLYYYLLYIDTKALFSMNRDLHVPYIHVRINVCLSVLSER